MGTIQRFTMGGSQEVVDLTASQTLTVADSGKVFMLNVLTGLTVTLPVLSGTFGTYYKFIISTAATSNSYVITENTGSDTNKMISKVAEAEVDTNSDGLYDAAHTTITIGTTGVVGDLIKCFSDGTNWYNTGYINADGACVLA